ncbi:uncharacterized protein BX664DRAFT_258347, partial [Halteromyces radiatus]|uniref:uncharacterized protein n=1 Tax=Halteromyces radiatus TaxID=101107 RepID=UPI00221F08D8
AMRGRIERARREKLFVISRNPKDSTKEEFQVTGSTGNLYTVKIGPILSCSCADFRYRRRHCKHMLMILLKMFSLPATSPIFQTMTPSHDVLRQIFSTCAPDPSTLIPEELKIMIDKKLNGEPNVLIFYLIRRSLDSSDCPVCCDEFKEEAILDILFCRVCGNNIHKTCFNMWKSTRQHDVTCVYCRSPWEDPAASKKKGKNIKLNHEGFVNFGVELGLSDVRGKL